MHIVFVRISVTTANKYYIFRISLQIMVMIVWYSVDDCSRSPQDYRSNYIISYKKGTRELVVELVT